MVVVEGTSVVGGRFATLTPTKGLVKFKRWMPLLRCWMCLYWLTRVDNGEGAIEEGVAGGGDGAVRQARRELNVLRRLSRSTSRKAVIVMSRAAWRKPSRAARVPSVGRSRKAARALV